MLVDRVGVEQVVLHAPDDPPESRDVEAQHAVGVHPLERAGHTLRRLEDFQEQTVVTRVLTEFFVNEPEVLLDQRDCARADALEIEVALQTHEDL